MAKTVVLTVFCFFSTISVAQDLECECGVKKESIVGTRIFGGDKTELNEFPWQVLLTVYLQSDSGKTNGFRCGGSLISDRHVLTAAHCITPNPFSGNISVLLGEHIQSEYEGKEILIKASNYLVHPKFNPEKFEHDYALLRLKEPLDFAQYSHIRPICLPKRRFVDFPDGSLAISVGWGRGTSDVKFAKTKKCDETLANRGCFLFGDEELSVSSDILQKLELFIVKHRRCAELYERFSNEFRPDNPVQIFGNNICATRPDKLGDVCQGDSGGSLMVKRNDGKYEIVGVVSYGFGCGSEFEGEPMPAIFGRVSSVVNWILRETRGGRFCS